MIANQSLTGERRRAFTLVELLVVIGIIADVGLGGLMNSTNGKPGGLYQATTLGKLPSAWQVSKAYPYAWGRLP
jgi:prepilin-type N-terminal cleavage/methylation domain-containing protein